MERSIKLWIMSSVFFFCENFLKKVNSDWIDRILAIKNKVSVSNNNATKPFLTFIDTRCFEKFLLC